MAETTEIEKKSLEAHVELCAERYRALEKSLEDVKQDVNDLKTTTHEVHDAVFQMANQRNTQLITWGIGVIGFLTAALGYMVSHYILK